MPRAKIPHRTHQDARSTPRRGRPPGKVRKMNGKAAPMTARGLIAAAKHANEATLGAVAAILDRISRTTRTATPPPTINGAAVHADINARATAVASTAARVAMLLRDLNPTDRELVIGAAGAAVADSLIVQAVDGR